MSSLSASQKTLTVTAYQGTTAVSSTTTTVQLAPLPTWMLQNNVYLTNAAFDPASGYSFKVYKKDIDYGFDTPSNWQWTPPFFSTPLVNLGNLHTGIDAGWTFTMASAPNGTVTASGTTYHIELFVLGQTVKTYDLPLGHNDSFATPDGSITGSLDVTLAPVFNTDLTFAPGVAASARMNLDIKKVVPLGGVSVQFGGVPALANVAQISIDASASVDVGLTATVAGNVVGGGLGITSATFHPNIDVGLTVTASGSIGNILGFSVAKASVAVTGDLKQDFTANYAGAAWTYDAPGSVTLSGTLAWDAVFGSWSGSSDLFQWNVASWDFVTQNGQPPIPNSNPIVPSPTVSSVSPGTFTGKPSSQTTHITILGSGFSPSSQLQFSDGTTAYPLRTPTVYDGPTQLEYDISTGTATADWYVRVQNGNNPPSNAVAFHVQSPSGTNTAPTISAVVAQTTSQNATLGPLAFTVGDAETSAGQLSVTATSSNQTLIPNVNITLGGSGANRTITLNPAGNQLGTTTITISVSDGSLGASTSFQLTVSASGVRPVITSVNPSSLVPLPLPQTQLLTINGSGFTSSATLSFIDTFGQSYTGRVPNSVTASQITYAVKVGTDLGQWTVQVISGGVASDPFAFSVSAANPAATPTISPNGATFSGSGNVALTTSTVGATIRYTLDGSDPTAASAIYGNALTLSTSVTVKARAFASGYADSAVASASFTVTAVLSAPVISSVSPSLLQPTSNIQNVSVYGSGFLPSCLLYFYDPNGNLVQNNQTVWVTSGRVDYGLGVNSMSGTWTVKVVNDPYGTPLASNVVLV